jgi:hypothetical protein
MLPFRWTFLYFLTHQHTSHIIIVVHTKNSTQHHPKRRISTHDSHHYHHGPHKEQHAASSSSSRTKLYIPCYSFYLDSLSFKISTVCHSICLLKERVYRSVLAVCIYYTVHVFVAPCFEFPSYLQYGIRLFPDVTCACSRFS